MPGTPQPVGQNGPVPPVWNAILQSIQALQAQVKALQAGQQNTILVDSNGNAIVVIGQLSQTVTIAANLAASPANPGVQVMTGLLGVGIAVQQSLATTTIHVTESSRTATVASATGLVDGMVIGAADVSDPSTGIATPAITPGTTISAISGTTVTLSAPAAETGSGLYCAACVWTSLQTAL